MHSARLKTRKFATVRGLILLVMDPKNAPAANIGFSVSLTPPPRRSWRLRRLHLLRVRFGHRDIGAGTESDMSGCQGVMLWRPSPTPYGSVAGGSTGDLVGHGSMVIGTASDGHVVPNLAAPGGQRMRCQFQLLRSGDGMAGGGQGQCQLPSGQTIDAEFPPS
jgi:hypothetical protein